MFGTLNLQPREPLTFVENPDLDSALSRSRRDKPHISCYFCRSRKVRCSGEATGCERCTSMKAECHYPSRDSRRKKRSESMKSSAQRPTSSNENSSREQTPLAASGNPQMSRISSTLHEPTSNASDIPSNDMCVDIGPLGDAGHMVSNFFGTNNKLDNWLTTDNLVDGTVPTQLHDIEHIWDDLDTSIYDTSSQSAPSVGTIPTDCSGSPQMDIFSQGPDMMATYEGSINDAGCPPLSFSCSSTATSSRQISQPPGDIGMPGYIETPIDFDTVSQRLTNTTASPTSHAQQTTGGECRCLQLCANLLEELSTKSACRQETGMDALLAGFKESMTRLVSILDCTECESRTENNMLLAMVAHYMSLICEQAVVVFVQSHQSGLNMTLPTQMAAPSVNQMEDTTPQTGMDEGWFSNYPMNGNYGGPHILTTVVSVQLTEFLRVLKRLCMRASRRSGQVAVLTEAVKRYQTTRALLKTSLSWDQE